jgi:hypothetical protein
MHTLLFLLLASAPAAADPLDDIPEYGDQKSEDESDESDDKLPALDDDDEFDLLEPKEEIATEGADTAPIFRETRDKLGELPPVEQLETWDEYIAKYPNSQFKEQIDRLRAEAETALYEERIGGQGGLSEPSGSERIGFSQAVQLNSIEARERLQLGFEWGNPDWLNLIADYEHAFNPRLSVHGGIVNRITGYRIEPGIHWSPVHSTKSGTVITLIGDLPINTNPAFIGLRPQLAIGQQLFERLDLQVQGGIEYEAREHGGIRAMGGGAALFRAAPRVALYVETKVQMQHFNWPGGAFYFHTATFGMRFFLGSSARKDAAEFTMGGSVPYAFGWWKPYKAGAVIAQSNIFFDD